MYARSFIDSLSFAENGRQISGKVPIAELPRLLEMLEDTQGTLEFTVRGGTDKQGNPFLDISISGNCRLRCQRCLSGMDYAVRHQVRLLLRDQVSLDALDMAGGEEDEIDSIPADNNLDVLDLLEEEILLSLPIAPRHEPGVCSMADGVIKHIEEKNPFAVLSKLKSN